MEAQIETGMLVKTLADLIKINTQMQTKVNKMIFDSTQVSESLNEGSIWGINEYTEDLFKFRVKQIIKLCVIFNNQTETFAVITHQFAAVNQPYLSKLEGL